MYIGRWNMKTVIAKIEGDKALGFNVYLPDNPMPFGCIGEGKTAKEAIDDFMGVYNAMKEDYEKETGLQLEYSFEFSYDVPSMLNYYKGILTLAGLQRITGINQMQMSQYVNGVRHPSQKTVSKIETSLRKFGEELCTLSVLL